MQIGRGRSARTEVFTSTDFDFQNIFDAASYKAALNPGLTIIAKDCSKVPAKEHTSWENALWHSISNPGIYARLVAEMEKALQECLDDESAAHS